MQSSFFEHVVETAHKKSRTPELNCSLINCSFLDFFPFSEMVAMGCASNLIGTHSVHRYIRM